MNSVKPTEDVTELNIELENYKQKIEELDTNNRDLNMQWGRLSVELREKEADFHAKVTHSADIKKLIIMDTTDVS